MTSALRSALSRRRFLTSTGVALLIAPAVSNGYARTITGLPWEPNAGDYPKPVVPGGWVFFTGDEGVAVEAIVDRLIPHDDLSVGGKEAGCAVYIDRQLAGSFGDSSWLYMRPPFAKGTPSQGMQSPVVPAQRFRTSLAALDSYCKQTYSGKGFAALGADQQDDLLKGLEAGKVQLPNVDGKAFFDLVLQSTMEGFFADPLYGGNKDMVSWKMIGFPGARYDYRDHISKHNQPYPNPPVSITGRADWSVRS
ncbi:gluconate 2-dehydrogenase gamma chain [Faunimonas pinastri]|uniref:Gluconate 2-dehydrogenase gamma chain n=1 Tax=Faunimonas pinastri TaxID=1855383 RepID=A0A1H9NU98_9HYPH|nr:gluconate 2-dehydrogenase subunit 3 family protein [Faunimonas pinastri]SER39614.1 gluconate 2-dehydrogenase gamma chain [Faunimonas pinastri]